MAFNVDLDFNERDFLGKLQQIGQGIDAAADKWDNLNRTVGAGNLSGQINNAINATSKGTSALVGFANQAGIAFDGKSVKQLNDELRKLTGTIDGASGVSDAVGSLVTEYGKLKKSADVLKSALKNATDPNVVKLYASSIATLNKGMAELEKTGKAAGLNVKKMSAEANTGKEVFNNFFGQFTKAGLIIAAVEAVIKFTTYAVGLSVAVDKSNKALEAYFQDASKAKQITNELVGLSQEKLLPLDQTLAAGKALAGYGIEADRIKFTLGNIAEISAATGKDLNELAAIYGKARTAGVLYAEDINQLLDAGVNIIPQFAKQLGISSEEVKKFASEGKIKFEELQLAFAELAGNGGIYSGQIAKQSETLGGAFNSLVARFQPWAKEIGDFFSDALKGVIDLTNTVIDKSVQAFESVKNLFKSEEEIRAARELENKKEDEQSRANYEKDLAFREKLEKEAADARNKKSKDQQDKERANREKAAKEEQEREKQRIAVRLSLISDETEQAVAQAQQRGKEEQDQIRQLFTKRGQLTAEGQQLIADSQAKTAAEIEKIQADQFTKEQELIAQRLENEKKFTASYLAEKTRQANGQKAVDELAVQQAEEVAQAYILRLKQQGASEEEIKTLQQEFDLEFKRRRLDNEIKFQQALLTTLGEGDEDRKKEIEAQIALLQSQLSNVQFELDNPEPIKVNKLIAALKKVKGEIAKSLGLDPSELKGVVDSAIGAFSDLFQATQELNQAQIDSNQQVIDALQEKIDKQQEAVDKEKQFAEAGKANNLKIEQEKLDALLKQEEEYEQKGQELRDKAAKRELIANTLSQVSNTVSAVAKIFNATAGIPVVGAILAGLQIAAMFTSIAAAREKAKAQATQKFFRGGEIPWGKSDENGGTGYRIEGTNMEVGGGEFIINRAVAQKNKPFLRALNDGEITVQEMSERYYANTAATNARFLQAADMVESAASVRSSRDTDRLIQRIDDNFRNMMRNGFLPLHELGVRFVDKDGNEIHYTTDPGRNMKKTKVNSDGTKS